MIVSVKGVNSRVLQNIIVDIGNPMSILANEPSVLADLPKNTLQGRESVALDDDNGIINNDIGIVNQVNSIIFLRVANIHPGRNPELYYDKAFDQAAVAIAHATAALADAANEASAIATAGVAAADPTVVNPADPAAAAAAAVAHANRRNNEANEAATAAAATAGRVNHGLERDGYLFRSPIGFIDTGLAMPILRRELRCDIKVGANGYTWVRASGRDTEVFIVNTIWQIQSLSIDQQRAEVINLLQRLR